VKSLTVQVTIVESVPVPSDVSVSCSVESVSVGLNDYGDG